MLVSEALAKLQEAALELSHSDICATLRAELKDMYPGEWCYVQDVFGDSESGDVVYCCQGEMWKAPYEIGEINGKRTCAIDDDEAVEVIQVTSYDEYADDDDHYAGMSDTEAEEARKMTPDERRMIFSERFISKSERDSADSGSFAGKGKSFPILKPGDVMAAVRSMGRAGSDNKSTAALKASIIRIAKKKGWAKYLPKAWQGGESKSEANRDGSGDVRLVEAAAFPAELDFRESTAAVNPLVKIISPGRGSSGYYTKELLERDGPQVFGRGTLMYINHATQAEEAARPEGDWTKLAAVTTEAARWNDNGPAGPALYAPAKVFSNFAAEVAEKAPYTGVSIRASGQYAESKTGIASPEVLYSESKLAPDGKPGLIGRLTRADSIDLVTKAGRDGKLLLESATTLQESDMNEAEITALIDRKVKESQAPLQAEIKRLRDHNAMLMAPKAIHEALATIRLPQPAKLKIIQRLAESVPLTEAGAVDKDKLKTLVETEALAEAQFLEALGFGAVEGLGTADPDPKKLEEREAKAFDDSMKDLAEIFCGDGKDNKKLRKAFREGRAA